MINRSRLLLSATAVAGVLVSGSAFAISGYSTAHLNLRTGPGTQYPVVGVMQTNLRSDITGCLADYSWCSVDVAGVSGWASAQYLVIDKDGQIDNVQATAAATGIPVVAAEGVAVVEAPATVGVVVGPSGAVAAIVPEPAVLEYISANPVPAVHVEGEIVVGAVLPEAVQLFEVPGSAYGYAIVNTVPVLVDLNARTIVYIHTA